jgi:hypothetical protein
MRLFFLLVAALGWPSQLRVEVRNSEVWLIHDEHEHQLTHDGKSKLQAELSPGKNRIAYYEQCTEAEHCKPTVIILELEGKPVASFQPKHQAVPPVEPCSSILSIAWVGDNTIAAVCHINPSLSEYIETDLSTGQTIRDLIGYDFAVSPDGKEVAHVGWIRHFAPPYAQSNYLQIDNTTIYPLPKGTLPIEQKGLQEPPEVVLQDGLTYKDIHDFMPGMFWAPDSQRIALIDCTYDWKANHPTSLSGGDGEDSNRRCSLAVVSKNGEAELFPLTNLFAEDSRKVSMSWTGPHQLALNIGSSARTFTVR